MRVERSRVARPDHRFDDTNPIVLEYDAMVIWCGTWSVQAVGNMIVLRHMPSLRVGIVTRRHRGTEPSTASTRWLSTRLTPSFETRR